MAATRNSTTEIPTEGKCIHYDRETGDYACYLNGELIGYASTYSEGETLCNQTYYAELAHTKSEVVEMSYQRGAECCGTEYIVEGATDAIRVHFPYAESLIERPVVFLNHEDAIDLERVICLLPLLQAVLDDPRVQVRWEMSKTRCARQATRPAHQLN